MADFVMLPEDVRRTLYDVAEHASVLIVTDPAHPTYPEAERRLVEALDRLQEVRRG